MFMVLLLLLMKRNMLKENKMSDNYYISVGLDYRSDGKEHEVEINYWDSDENEAYGKATSDSFDKSATNAFENLVVDLASQKKEDEVDYRGDLQEYIADLEEYVADLEDESDALLEENDRLEYRIQELQKRLLISRSIRTTCGVR